MKNLKVLDNAIQAVQNPATSADDLALIAYYHPELRQLASAHPNAYPATRTIGGNEHTTGLAGQNSSQGGDESGFRRVDVQSSWPLAQLASPGESPPIHGASAELDVYEPASSPKPNRRVKLVAIIAGIVLAIAGVGVAGFYAFNNPTAETVPPDVNLPSDMGAWDKNGDGILKVGFSQTGSESDWRVKNSVSFAEYFGPANGFDLLFADANGDDAQQKLMVRQFIAEDAEVIIIQPLNSDGWEPILQEAKAADIPVIISDRRITGLDDDYKFFFGSDFRGEGDRAMEWLERYIADNDWKNEDIKIVHLRGVLGSDTQQGRTEGVEMAVDRNHWTIVEQASGSDSEYAGQEAMVAILDRIGPKDFNVLVAENDEMVFGAINALKANGLDPKDYVIISFDASKKAVEMVKDGTIDAIAEHSPIFGPQIGELIVRASKGEKVPSPVFASEEVVDSTNVDTKLEVAY